MLCLLPASRKLKLRRKCYLRRTSATLSLAAMTTGSEWRAQVGRSWAESYRLTDRAFSGLTERLLGRIGGCEGQSALDIGCGAGYFLYICKWLGHDVRGLDIDESAMFTELTKMLRISRVIWRIERYVPLPDLGPKFDVITAYMICFNDHKTDHIWGPAEWEFFLADVARHLTPSGRIHLEFNREFDGTWYTQELHDYFAKRGAEIDRHRVAFTAKTRARA